MIDLAERIEAGIELADQLRAAHAVCAAADAAKVRLATDLYELRRTQQEPFATHGVRPGESAAKEIAVTLKCSELQADKDITLGLALRHRFTHTDSAFAAGELDAAKARIICTELDSVSDAVVAVLEERIVAYAKHSDPNTLRRTIRRWVLQLDAEAQIKRRRQSERERDVTIYAREDGVSGVDATMTAEGGRALYHRLREMATTEVCSRDPRSLGELRSDALAALADSGRLTCQCNRPNCPRAGDATAEPRRALVHVGVSAETLLGLQNNPALLQGFGAIDADLARRIAKHARFMVFPETVERLAVPEMSVPQADSVAVEATDTSVQLVESPVTTELPSAPSESELHYRPSQSLVERLRALDGVCRTPGCGTPAATTDLDHVIPFNHRVPEQGGRTTESNLACRCRRHHRLKTGIDNGYVDWRIRQLPGRREEWITPAGVSMVSAPEGVEYLFPSERVVAKAEVADEGDRGERDLGCPMHLYELIRLEKVPDKRGRAWDPLDDHVTILDVPPPF